MAKDLLSLVENIKLQKQTKKVNIKKTIVKYLKTKDKKIIKATNGNKFNTVHGQQSLPSYQK